jgi:RNA-directed DNA polymerase
MTNESGKSDRPVVPEKSSNNAGQPVSEGMEGRGLAKGNQPQQNASRTPSREDALSALERVRQAAKQDKKLRFTALLHHIYDPERLREAYFCLKKEAAPGVDGETWRHYGESLEDNLQDLSHRLKRGAYRAKPVRRVYIAKADGRQRPLGVTALEDKIVQRAAVEVMNAIYETDFLGFSYGFRPGRSQHQALDALYTGLLTRKVNWVLDVDIRGLFDRVNHDRLIAAVAERVADKRMLKLIRAFLKAGVMEDGLVSPVDEGTPQGGPLSPLLSNLVLDELDRELERRDHRFVRYADDCNVYVGSERAGQRVMESVTHFIMHRLNLKVNQAKSAVARPGRRKFLGFSFTGEQEPRGNVMLIARQRAVTCCYTSLESMNIRSCALLEASDGA